MCSIHFHFQINVPIFYSKIRVLFFSSVFRSALSFVLKQLLMKLLNIFLLGVFIFHVSLARRSTGLSRMRYYLISKLLDDDQMPRLLLLFLLPDLTLSRCPKCALSTHVSSFPPLHCSSTSYASLKALCSFYCHNFLG